MVFPIRTVSRPTPLLIAAFATAIVLAPCAGLATADDETQAKVLKDLAGTWTSEEPVESSWTFDGKTLKTSVNGMDYTCKVKADPKSKPAEIDFVIDEGPDEAKGKTSKCIYKLEGDKLTLCVSLPGKDRPKEFEQEEGEHYLFELKKEKPKDKDKSDKKADEAKS